VRFGGDSGKPLTPEGGIFTWVINKTGGASIKGMIVEASDTMDNAVQYAATGDIDPIGIVYDSGVPDGSWIRIIVAGIAEVLYGTATTRGYIARVSVSADSITAGQAVAEALPTSPFATDKHFQEIGHPVEEIAAPGLAKTIIHFN
jgi:hypothetical protein